ncbi:MAG: FecR domain-containing protein [Pseudomonadota bacterium]
MQINKGLLVIIYCCTCLVLTLSTVTATAAERCNNAVARTLSVQGSFEVRYAGQSNWQAAKLNDRFCTGDALRTGQDSRVALMLLPETVIRLDQLSSMVFTRPDTDASPSWLELLKGAAHFISRDPRALQIITPFANAAIEGTEFLVQVDEQQTGVTVYEGKVLVGNNSGSVAVTSGKQAIAQAGQAPVAQAVVHPRDAVQWTLYYPPVMQQGDATTRQAAAALAVGQVDNADVLLDQALATNAGNSDALALRSIIAVTQNDKASALTLANQAVSADPNSAAGYIALSYAQQAHFDLSGALNSLQQATQHEPDNALGQARLAEMWLSVGDLDKGLAAAEQAHAIDPNQSLTQTVLGFSYLTRIKIPESLDAFNRAIMLDQAAPLPRLGLGLAKIRKGDLEAGREEIEIAVILDPGNSLIRSYMGKAYYEEKRDKLAATQYDMAKELDPNDPTPWYYDAIRKQTENRPVEALHDLQESIKLNDNRAVYRSRLELDADLATRSASIARIYNDLGFQQRALVEGWQSVNTDPGNFSAHRLLADSYSALPRHEVARVSELLQSQLLQPINLNPVQPQLAETNLSVLDNAGPSDPAFLEFNPLFTRNRVALQLNGVGGSNSTRGDDLVLNGVHNRWSWSLGQYHYQTDGYRDNNDQKRNIYNLFVQGALSHKTSILGELRYADEDFGDLNLRFAGDDFEPNQRHDEELKSARAGLRHAFSPRSELIATLVYADGDNSATDRFGFDFPPFFFGNELDLGISSDDKGWTGELQHQFRADSYTLISGIGHTDADREETISQQYAFEFPPFFVDSTQKDDTDLRQSNIYLYSLFDLPHDITLTVGASGDTFDNGRIDKQQFNPKLGVEWDATTDTTVRAAAFRTLQRLTSISPQTIEPTQVAGFNQLYEGADGEQAWRYGLALDHSFSNSLYGGAEFSYRDLEVPSTSITTGELSDADWNEQLARAYLYWAPHPQLALNAEYQYERFDRDPEFPGVEQISDLKTHRLPLGVSWFSPGGLIGKLSTTYVNQDGEFGLGLAGNQTERDSDNFWIVDASLGYRLPKRYGIVSLGVLNLLDEEFKFQDTDPALPQIAPERTVLLKFTLAVDWESGHAGQ